jgi:CspA family cold shock protein
MQTTGTVREWNTGEGWGVIDSPDTPGGCWAHFSSVLRGGFRELTPGGTVSIEYETARQDGYAYRAIAVWTGDEPAEVPPAQRSVAYESSLRLYPD